MSDEDRGLLSRYYHAVWEAGNVDALDELLTDDYLDHDPSPGFGPDQQAAKNLAAAVTSGMKDGRLTIHDVVVEGDRAAAHWTHTWTQVGDFLGRVPADGRQLHLRGHDFFRLRDGRIAEIWHCEDFMGVLSQLEVLARPGLTQSADPGWSATASRESAAPCSKTDKGRHQPATVQVPPISLLSAVCASGFRLRS